ncbi:MAG: hypothetical protein HPZ91_04935 [Lentisphaeria bacterium]|nr:hypothetical protein [Lentisphaeria bacterium]
MNVRESWFSQARFGMFIHWGLYAIPAGEWNGAPVKGIGEQIMRFARIPAAEYEKLAGQFNPREFDADAWAALAEAAGMKYLVLTAKHHDGFALFDTAVSDFSVMKASPFRRDIVAELAAACARHKLKFCVYYSQRQDWHEPDGVWNEWPGQFPVPVEKRGFDFSRYMNAKALPQVRELLTQYGPVGVVWYDTPTDSTPEQSEAFAGLVHELQPECLVCDRVGNGRGDYAVLGDNEFPYCAGELNGEVPATMNHTWGFKKDDDSWKSVRELLYSLIRSVANGCNYLLNVGPDASGRIPAPCAERLRAIGKWMKVNAEAIHGATSVPFAVPPEWGMATASGSRLNLIFSEWPGSTFMLDGLLNEVVNVRLPALPGTCVKAERRGGAWSLSGLPEHAPDPDFSVVVLELDSPVRVDPELRQSSNGSITLLAGRAEIRPAPGGRLALDGKGLPLNFRPGTGKLAWRFRVDRPGRFRAEALTNRHWSCKWIDGIELSLSGSAGNLRRILTEDLPLQNLQTKYHPETVSRLGELTFATPGEYTLELELLRMPEFKAVNALSEDDGDNRTLNLIELKLLPLQK